MALPQSLDRSLHSAPTFQKSVERPGGRKPSRDQSCSSYAYSDVSQFSGFYNYKPIHDDEVRLLLLEPPRMENDEIYCKTITTPIDQAPLYEALSHEWGSTERQKDIMMDGRVARVRRNLWHALRAIRYHARGQPRGLWIDAICIDPCDNVEKFQQISQMGPIYERASCVICWLGTSSPDSDLAVSFLKSATDLLAEFGPHFALTDRAAQVFTDWMCSNDHGPFDRAIEHLLNYRSYWSRIWIRQEIILAEDIFIYCGNNKIHWVDAHAVCKLLWGNTRLLDRFCIPGLNYSRDMHGMRKDDQWLLAELGNTRTSKETGPRDKAFGLLGLFQYKAPSDSYRLRPDYRLSFFNVCSQVFKFCVFNEFEDARRESCLSILCMSRPSFSKMDGLPTWLADWSAEDTPESIISLRAFQRLRLPSASLKQPPRFRLRPDGLRLNCRGVSLGRVRESGHPLIQPEDRASRRATLKNWWQIAYNSCGGQLREKDFVVSLFCLTCDHLPSPLQIGFVEWLKKSYKLDLLSNSLLKDALVLLSKSKRVFAVSENGEFLIIPQEGQVGDVLCIIYGCETPILLRPKSDRSFTSVGDYYVHGSMFGEAIEKLGEGIHGSRTFQLQRVVANKSSCKSSQNCCTSEILEEENSVLRQGSCRGVRILVIFETGVVRTLPLPKTLSQKSEPRYECFC